MYCRENEIGENGLKRLERTVGVVIIGKVPYEEGNWS